MFWTLALSASPLHSSLSPSTLLRSLQTCSNPKRSKSNPPFSSVSGSSKSSKPTLNGKVLSCLTAQIGIGTKKERLSSDRILLLKRNKPNEVLKRPPERQKASRMATLLRKLKLLKGHPSRSLNTSQKRLIRKKSLAKSDHSWRKYLIEGTLRVYSKSTINMCRRKHTTRRFSVDYPFS